MSCAHNNEENKMFDPGGAASTTKATLSGVMCMDVNRMRHTNTVVLECKLIYPPTHTAMLSLVIPLQY